ncbi:hypothetical protein AWV80_16535 [Cupriavidus sp. UYMU48A]|nr:hypothetical protein AWV80_16535 [Cupriavidus sp. UYMU48A]
MDELQDAIEGMFEAVDALQPLIGWQVRQLSVCDPGLAAPALTGKMLGDLREYGGRAASQIMAPVAAHQPIPIRSLADTSRSRGRLLELWELAGPAYNMYGEAPRLEHAYATRATSSSATACPCSTAWWRRAACPGITR